MKIYTKTGDRGETGLLGGDRITKTSARIEVIGTVDELNSHIGLCVLHCRNEVIVSRLTRLQNQLFDLGSQLACPPGGKFQLMSISGVDIEELEREIDEMTAEMPELKAFILPGGSAESSHLHLARAVCRRLERLLYLLHATEPLENEPLMFVNRLSDWIFCTARFANHTLGVADVPWQKRETK